MQYDQSVFAARDITGATVKLFPMKVLDRFSVWDTLNFDSIGIVTKNRNGYIYPNSDQAASELDALRFETEHLGVQTVLSCHIKKAWKMKNGMFTVESDQGTFKVDSLILAAGSKAAPVSGSDGSGTWQNPSGIPSSSRFRH